MDDIKNADLRRVLGERLERAKEVLAIQDVESTASSDKYHVGLYNGMELVVSIIEGRAPVYKEITAVPAGLVDKSAKDEANNG